MKLGIALGISVLVLGAQEAPWPKLKPVLVAQGLQYPVDIQSAGDGSGRLFIVEQAGRIRVWENGRLLAVPFLDIRAKVRWGDERGLLGLAFSPHYQTNGVFYVNYTEGTGAPDLRTVIARYRRSSADPNVADGGSEERVLVVDQPYDNHNAGQLAFSPRDGMLYVGLGDGGGGGDPQNNAQNPSRLLGKMLRLDVEGQARPVPEIRALGLRNPWRYSFDRETHDLWIGDVGQGRLEEIDFQPADAGPGLNYGWPQMEGTSCYRQAGCSTNGLVLPVFEYGRDLGIAVTGGYVYRGTVYAERKGTYFLADFGSGRMWGIRREGTQWASRELAHWTGWNIATLGQGEDGELYVAAYGSDGAVYRLADVTPVTRPDLVVNAATGEPGAVPGGRINIYGWGIVGGTGKTQVWFDGIEAEVVAAENLGGQELIVAVAPPQLAGRLSAKVVVAAGEGRSAEVEVTVPAVQPGIFDFGYEAAAGGALELEATGLGSCGRHLLALIGESPAEVRGCRASDYHSGAQVVTVAVPAELAAGETSVRLTADGVESRAVRVRVRR